MVHRKKVEDGVNERFKPLRPLFPDIDRQLQNRAPGVGKDDLLDSAVAAWSALRLHKGESRSVCEPERDSTGLMVNIWY